MISRNQTYTESGENAAGENPAYAGQPRKGQLARSDSNSAG